MASAVALVPVGIIVVAVGAIFGVILIVAAEDKAEENVARKRRPTTLYGEATSTVTRGVRRLTGAGRDPRN
jgi:hypothetical protein